VTRLSRPTRLAAVRARLGQVPRPLALLLVLAAIQVVAWSVVTAPFQGPDEYGHFAYAQYLAETGKLQSSTTGRDPLSSELRTALVQLNLRSSLGVPAAKPGWTAAEQDLWRRYEARVTHKQRANGNGPSIFAKNPPLYYAYVAIPYEVFRGADLFTRLFFMRMASALLYLAAVALTWLMARELFGPRLWPCTLATAAVALLPKLAFMGAVLNPDIMLVAVWAAFGVVALRTVRLGPSVRRVVGLSLLAVASALTQGRGLAISGPYVVTLAATLVRHRPARREAVRALGAGAAVVGVPLLAYRLALGARGNGGQLYGGEVNAGSAFNLRQFASYLWQFYLPRLSFMQPRLGPAYGYRQVFIDSFFGTFGALEVRWKASINEFLQIAAALGLAGLLGAVVVRFQTLRRNWAPALVLLSMLVSMLGLLHYASYRALLGGGADPLITGRYLLPLAPLFGVALAFTLASLPRRVSALAGAFVIAAGVLLQLEGLGLTFTRFHA
jgi:Predicted membrane protein (DUF2142)